MRWPIATATRETAVTHGYARHRPRLAILGSPGLAYLRGRICAASIRQGFDVDLFPTSCTKYGKLLADRSSDLSRFLPKVVLLVVAADYPSAPQESGRPSALTRRAKQQLGAVLVCSAILPVLLSLCGSQATRSNTPLLSVLDAIERQLCKFRDRERVELSSTGRAQPELLIQWHLPPMWRRRKPQSAQVLLNLYPVGRTFAALFGLDYFCVVVDVNNHPWRWTVILLLSFYFGTKRNRPEKSVAPRGEVLTPFCLWIMIPWSLRHYNGFAIHWSVLPGIETCPQTYRADLAELYDEGACAWNRSQFQNQSRSAGEFTAWPYSRRHLRTAGMRCLSWQPPLAKHMILESKDIPQALPRESPGDQLPEKLPGKCHKAKDRERPAWRIFTPFASSTLEISRTPGTWTCVGSSQKCSEPSAGGKDKLRSEGKAIQIYPPGLILKQRVARIGAGVVICSTT